ncbi:MAG: hypothetical protein Q8Q49_03650 [bacterium]|nr:hypothetical protein [bacterium]
MELIATGIIVVVTISSLVLLLSMVAYDFFEILTGTSPFLNTSLKK